MKTRLDAELVRRGLARSRDNAIDLIDTGQVLVNGIPASKAASHSAESKRPLCTSSRSASLSQRAHGLI